MTLVRLQSCQWFQFDLFSMQHLQPHGQQRDLIRLAADRLGGEYFFKVEYSMNQLIRVYK